jgi:hypothetical protein
VRCQKRKILNLHRETKSVNTKGKKESLRAARKEKLKTEIKRRQRKRKIE